MLDILARLGELEWYGIRRAEVSNSHAPPSGVPVITFRFSETNSNQHHAIRTALSSYHGAFNWTISNEGDKNWTITILEACEHGRPSITRARRWGSEHPQAMVAIGKDYASLLAHLERELG